jgi:hypothetical protein
MAFFFMLSPSIDANAANVRMDTIPSLRIEEGWHSNVYNSSDDEVSSLGTRLSPGLALRFTAPDNVMLQISGNYEKLWYHDPDAKDAEDSTWHFRVDSSGGWRLAPTFSIRPSVYYLSTTDSYRRVQLVPSGDPLVPPVTITNYGATKSNEFGGGIAFEYLASPNLSFGVSGNYRRQRFPGDNVVSGLTDSAQGGGGISVNYLFSPRSRLGLVASGSHQTNDNNVSTDTLSAGVQFGYLISPVLRFDGTLGGSRIRQADAPGGADESKSSPSGSFNIAYLSDTYKVDLYGSYVYTGGSGFGEATRQGTVGVAFTNHLTREWSWNLTGAYQDSKSVFNEEAVKIKTTYGKVGVNYRPWEWITLDLSGNLNRQKSDGLFGATIDNYSAVLGCTIGKPFNLY